jgi:hypothetical protein
MKQARNILIVMLIAVPAFFFTQIQDTQAADCKVISIQVNQKGPKDSSFFKDSARPQIVFDLTGNANCPEKIVEFSIVEVDGLFDDDVDNFDNRKVAFDSNSKVTLTVRAGEDECEGSICHYAVEINDDDGETETEDVSPSSSLFWELKYPCDGSCDTPWELISIEPQQTNGIIVSGLHQTGVDPNCVDKNGNEIPNCYGLLAPLPGLNHVEENLGIGQYLNTVVQVIIGIIGVLAVVMIMVGGIQYMTTDAIAGKENGRQTIQAAVLGLLLALGSFVLLNTIDPDLTRLEPKIGSVTAHIENSRVVPDRSYKALTGRDLPTDEEVLEAIKEVSQEAPIEQCIVEAIVGIETGSGANISNIGARIGQDENVAGTDSWESFRNSEKTYRGVNKGAGTPVQNDNNADEGRPWRLDETNDECWNTVGSTTPKDHLCLDWRFSQGIGFMQITFFPNSGDGFPKNRINNPVPFSQRKNTPTRTINGKTYKPKDMLNIKPNITAGVDILKDNIKVCGKEVGGGTKQIEAAFRRYNAGACTASGGNVDAYANTAVDLYQQCLDKK